MKTISKILLSTALSVFVLSACMSDEGNKSTAALESNAVAAQPEAATSQSEVPTADQALAVDSAQQAESMVDRFVEGQHYRELSTPLPTEAPDGQVEVAEMFWYGCPHCFNLETTMKEYVQNKPANVYFRRIPATLNPQWGVHARAYYIGQLLDADGTKNLHDKIFGAIHTQRRRLQDDAAVNNFFVSQGFTEEQVNAAANSMEVQMKVKMAIDYSTASQATGVPTLIVDGKYLTSPTMAQGSAKLKRVLNYLVNKSSE